VLGDEESKTCDDARAKQLLVTSISCSTLASDVAPGESLHAASMPTNFSRETKFHPARLWLSAERVGVYEDTR
jgi:hypothetical protein